MRFYNFLLVGLEKLQDLLIRLCDISHKSYLLSILTFIPICILLVLATVYSFVFTFVRILYESVLGGDFDESQENNQDV